MPKLGMESSTLDVFTHISLVDHYDWYDGCTFRLHHVNGGFSDGDEKLLYVKYIAIGF